MHLAIAQPGLLHIATLIEAKLRILAGAAEMSVIGSAFLSAVARPPTTCRIKGSTGSRLASLVSA